MLSGCFLTGKNKDVWTLLPTDLQGLGGRVFRVFRRSYFFKKIKATIRNSLKDQQYEPDGQDDVCKEKKTFVWVDNKRLLNWLVWANCFQQRKKQGWNSCLNTKVLLFFGFFSVYRKEKKNNLRARSLAAKFCTTMKKTNFLKDKCEWTCEGRRSYREYRGGGGSW